MAEWIPDGYGRVIEFGGARFDYRPLPSGIRDQLAIRLSAMEEEELQVSVIRLCNDRLIERTVPSDIANDEIQLARFWHVLSGSSTFLDERQDEWNLRAGIQILERFPHLERFTCEECKTFWYDIDTGDCVVRDGQRVTREGAPPCDMGDPEVTCPIHHWKQQRRLSVKNRTALRFHMECEATGRFPDDPIVRKNAALIQWAYRVAKELKCRR